MFFLTCYPEGCDLKVCGMRFKLCDAPRGKYNVILSCACESAWHHFNRACFNRFLRMFTPRGRSTYVARVRSVGPWAFCSSDSFLPPGPYGNHPPRLCKYSRGLGRNGIAHRIRHSLGTVEHSPSRHAIAAIPLHHKSGLQQQRSRSSRHYRATVTPRSKAPGQTFRCTS